MTDKPHEWIKSPLGHGHLMCKHCKGTAAELAAIAPLYDYDVMNVCKTREDKEEETA